MGHIIQQVAAHVNFYDLIRRAHPGPGHNHLETRAIDGCRFLVDLLGCQVGRVDDIPAGLQPGLHAIG